MPNLCLTIGVSTASPLAYLPGAITAAHEMSEWARQSGFVTEIITDEDNNPVTIARIREKLLLMLPDNAEIDLFILHFAGHGFRTGAEQNVWLPSDWEYEMRAISVEGLRRQLYRHGIKNLSIFSDACRSLPSDIETADIAQDHVLPRGPYDVTIPVLDRFNAVMDGQQAYMLKGDKLSPPRCIFSTVLLEGLCGQSSEAFDIHLRDCVIPESLALFAQKRMREIGELYRLKCIPEYATGIPRDHAVYFKNGNIPNVKIPKFQWPAPPDEYYVTPNVLNEAESDGEGAFEFEFDSGDDFEHEYFQQNETIDTPWQFERINDHGANFIVHGMIPKQIWSTHFSTSIRPGEYYIEILNGDAVQVLVEFDDGMVASVVVYSDLITILSRDHRGYMGWLCIERLKDSNFQQQHSIQAIADLQIGNLSADQVDKFATKLRMMKHINPILGAISSYLYDYVGDIDNIHRMAYFYCDHLQPIPFDIVLMGLLPTNYHQSRYETSVPAVEARISSPINESLPDWVRSATPVSNGTVAGLWPWLRQGWQFIEDPELEEVFIAERLQDVIPFMLPSQFSSFRLEGAEILIRKFNMEKNR
ncbi:caspase family protein [Pseudocitrobacter corydidari]|uniref:Peptidase C14 caspase domain-containing protein n=1 Tax=Pseudocitrobacter corydidari TaxID=2891570 RepID=A0ABY3S312_9ENTR|nr:caspase family protein [Pseudocitrobacter corydidari]UGS41120.1 hypothetical protein G163CM_18210 [Pseudocitrobacter corydidari]